MKAFSSNKIHKMKKIKKKEMKGKNNSKYKHQKNTNSLILTSFFNGSGN